MTAQEHIKAGQLDEALVALQESIRSNPGDLQERICLFQLYCVFGRWDKALTQLQVLADLNAETFLLSRLFGPVIQCEMLRGEIFAGNRTPLIFGEPAPWVSWLVQASALVAQGQWVAAGTLRDQAFEAAPPTPGSIDGQPFEWIADSDSRLGPILELILEGKYYWIPFCRIKSIHMTAPTDLRDLVWQPAQLVWANGGQAAGHIPTRYPDTEQANDHRLRLARKTEWIQHEPGYCLGRGQRVLATDRDDFSLLDCRNIELAPAD